MPAMRPRRSLSPNTVPHGHPAANAAPASRGFARLGLALWGLALLLALSAGALAAGPDRRPDAPPGAAPALADREPIRLGMSAAFNGPSRALGIELWRGASAYFRYVNEEKGGLFGRPVELVALDDSYDPTPAILNTIELVERRRVLALFGYVGTPTVTRVLPLLQKYEPLGMRLLFPFTGAQPQREAPYDRFVVNLRASYRDETKALVDKLVEHGVTRVAVFYQADAYGRSGWDGARRALAEHGEAIVAEATYRRGAPFSASFAAQVDILLAAHPQAVITAGSYEACAGFIRDLRDAGSDIPVASLSFAGSENLLEYLNRAGFENGRDYTHGLVASEVVPSFEDLSLPAVREYRALMDALAPPPPEHLMKDAYLPRRYGFVSLEGFLNAKLLCAAIERFGRVPRRDELMQAFAAVKDLDLGIGQDVSFSDQGPRLQGLSRVWLTTVREGRVVPLDDRPEIPGEAAR